MRAGQFRSRVAGLLLSAVALTWLVPLHAARGIDEQHQPAAPAHMQWFDPEEPAPAKAWTPIERAAVDDERVVLLVHGLDEPGTVWDALAPELAERQWTTIRFEYPNDQAIAYSAKQFDEALAELGKKDVKEVWIVAHSMGGLVTLDALTREGFDRSAWPEVRRVITLGTPMGGSLLAPMRFVAELREHAFRAIQDGKLDESDLEEMSDDGQGQAGRDLMPGSEFLTELHGRPRPEHVAITAIVADVPKPEAEAVSRAILEHAPDMVSTDPEARQAVQDFSVWTSRWMGEAVDLIGDGVVDADSSRSAWTTDVVPVRALHRSMITRVPCPIRGDAEPPAIEIILDRLARDQDTPR